MRVKDLNGLHISTISKSHYDRPPPPPLQAAVVCREGNCIKRETDFYCLPEEEDCRCPQGPGDL